MSADFLVANLHHVFIGGVQLTRLGPLIDEFLGMRGQLAVFRRNQLAEVGGILAVLLEQCLGDA